MSFDVLQVGGEAKNKVVVALEHLTGIGGPAHPVLSIPFKTALRPLGKTGASYTILSADGSLYIGAAAVEGHCDLRVTNVRAHDYETEFSAHFPLDRLELEQIEKVRAGGDVKARCDLRFTVALSHDLDIGKPEGPQPFVTSYESAFVQLEFTIPHSTWTNRVLAGFGHGRIQLLEVPVPAKHAPEVFAGAVAELAQARAYYLDADYEKVMSHCRKSLESILIVLKPDLSGLDKPGFGQKLARTLEQHLSQQLSESKRASMHGTATAIWNLTSISTHHLGGPEYFDRADAEATMLHCSALLAHVGHAIRRKEDSEK